MPRRLRRRDGRQQPRRKVIFLNQVGWMIIWFGRWTLVGVTSFGVDCARPDFPGKILDNLRIFAQLGCDLFSAGVYTRVDQYLDWIRSNV